jgi:spore coat protein U-like protein
MTRRCVIAMLLLAASALKPAAAQSCYGYSASILFSNYSGTTVDVTGSVTVNCTKGTVYHIGLNAGNTPGSTITNRRMFGGNGGQNYLGYQLFSDAARTINWGDSSGTNWVTATGNGSDQPHTVYARAPAGEFSPLGSYTDTITATISGNFAIVKAPAPFSVTATAVPGCEIAATALNFGAYGGTLINSASSISVTCSPGVAYNVGLNAGTAAGATVTNRSMTGPGGKLLHYELCRDAARTRNWGNTVGVDTVPGNGNGTPKLWSVFGQLPDSQSVRPGNYSDTITATVTF